MKGKPGIHTVAYAMLIPTPCIINHDFTMKDVEMYKFIENTGNFYAYPQDMTKATK